MKSRLAVCLTIVLICSCTKDSLYRDGMYRVATPPDYEGYSSEISMEIEDDKILSIEWKIFDTVRKRYFDETYEEVFKGSPVYIEQCRGDLKGLDVYPEKLLTLQALDAVDAVTGATWTRRKFGEAVKAVLDKASGKK